MTIKTHRKRTVASAITYRVTSTILLAAISYVVTGEWVESLAVTLSFAVLATILCYFNDRAWERTDWGRKAERTRDSSILMSNPSLTMSKSWSEVIPVQHPLLGEAS